MMTPKMRRFRKKKSPLKKAKKGKYKHQNHPKRMELLNFIEKLTPAMSKKLRTYFLG